MTTDLNRVAVPHHIEPLQWTAWKNYYKSDNATQVLHNDAIKTISSLIWNDLDDPLQLKSKPYYLHTSGGGDGIDPTLRLDLPPPSHLESNNEKLFRLKDFSTTRENCLDDAMLSSRDPVTGKQLSLTTQQRKALKLHGQINIPSRRFVSIQSKQPQNHTWQVARGLYSGTVTIWNDFTTYGLGVALNHMIYSSDVLYSLFRPINQYVSPSTSFHSVFQTFLLAVKAIWAGLTHVVQTSNRPKYCDHAIHILLDEAKDRYVYAQFAGTTDHTYETMESGSNSWMLPLQKKCDLYYAKGSLQYVHELWDALQIDGEWTLGMDQLIDENWNFAKRAHDQLDFIRRSSKVQQNEISHDNDDTNARVSTRAAQRHLRKFKKLQQSNDIEQLINEIERSSILGPYAEYETERIRADQIETSQRQEDYEAILTETEEAMDIICARSPIMSLSTEWKRRQRERNADIATSKRNETFEERLIERLLNEKLDRMALIRKHTNDFNHKHRASLERKLRTIHIPSSPASFQVLQFNPKNWDPYRHKVVKVSSEKPWWRIRYTFMVFWSATKEVIGGSFHFLLHGPLSLRALFSRHPFHAVSHDNVRDQLRQTLVSRLERFWSDLYDIRQKFEREPDTGLLGKSVTRPILYAYLLFKCAIGTAWITLFMILGTIAASLLASAAIVTGPLIGVSWTLMVTAFYLAIYDLPLSNSLSGRMNLKGFASYHLSEGTSTYSEYRSISPLIKIGVIAPYHLLKCVFISFIALSKLCVVHPAIAMLRLMWSGIRLSLRLFRDALTWPILSAMARAPATGTDTWLSYRIHGPGVASEQYYRLPLWSAKMAILLHLDAVRLELHHLLRMKEFTAPYNDFIQVFQNLSRLGMKCSTEIKNPVSLAQQVSNGFFFHKRKGHLHLSRIENNDGLVLDRPSNIWERCSHVLSHHYPYDEETDVTPYKLGRNKSSSLKVIDTLIANHSGGSNKSPTRPPLQQIVDSIVPSCATWLSQKRYRDELFREAIGLPANVQGRFRLSDNELDELWNFTLQQVDRYESIVRSELEYISDTSVWLQKEDGTLIADMYNGERNMSSNAVTAFQLLCNLFGETAMVETLEEIDETLVLDAGVALEDRHLMIWTEYQPTGTIDNKTKS